MRIRSAPAVAALCCAALLAASATRAAVPERRAADGARLDNAACLECHDGRKKIAQPAAEDDEAARALRGVPPDRYARSVHAGMACVDCHAEIVDAASPHRKTATPPPDCAACHEALDKEARRSGTAPAKPRLDLVAKNIAAYRRSFHARPDADNPSRPKATCTQCHDTHAFDVPADKRSPAYAAWRAGIPKLCGETCHEDQLEAFAESVHGAELEKGNAKSAVCTSCHTTHEITNTSLASFKLLNNEECGSCHMHNLRTYRDTYHGQVTKLGYAETAKCYDCHGSHEVLSPDNRASTVHPAKRLKTCQKCHDGKKRPLATVGFATFGPHAHAGDFEKYPQMWIAAKFMGALLVGVFAFFWAHSLLWYYREWQERKLGHTVTYIRTASLLPQGPQFQRFGLGWRIGHLLFALVTMTLVLTGTAALFSHTGWAPAVARALGGAQGLALIHRVAAALFLGIFFVHFVYVMQKLLRDRSFRWFGPDSLIPNWKDLADVVAMFKWFVGKGPRPRFERWAYYEKFDYWAVFWGVTIIGVSGIMLAFPHVTGEFLPGWVFNVGTLVHGEEAFLAAVFLFTVHFFNNHFRPDKLPPPDIVMFTGTQSIEEFRHDHPAHYQRLVDSGELEKHLVEAPSRPMTVGSIVLGVVLLGFGLTLLVLVGIGFFTAE